MSYEEYVRENKIEDKSEDEKNLELIVSIIKTKNELDAANKNFEYEDEEYYYYVRAIPKISMEEEMSVKKVIVPARRFYLKHKEKHDDKGEES